ncbi:hypothetical protein EUGRSUZ_C03322 [Eucalyptus grandis]|uniref:Uncharacterized protein n=2 Tax=Eucalyptus grandis TaxID=71139 RepID=A0ACC3LIJ3_EUCGR|nr:hypothetical protein EUGRSUZ_C03322 [Eucalyptus grandis]
MGINIFRITSSSDYYFYPIKDGQSISKLRVRSNRASLSLSPLFLSLSSFSLLGSNNRGAKMMHMTLYWSRYVTLLVDSWRTDSWPSYFLSLVACFLVSAFYQYMEDRRIRFRSLASSSSASAAARRYCSSKFSAFDVFLFRSSLFPSHRVISVSRNLLYYQSAIVNANRSCSGSG